MTRLRLLPLHLLVVLGLLFAACGDDDDAAVAADDPSEDTGTDDADADADEGEGEDASEDEGDDSSEPVVGGDCGFLVQFAGAFDDFDPSAAFASGEAVDFGALFEGVAEQFDEVADAAPSEISDAFGTLADAFAIVVEELDGVVIDLSDPENVDPAAFEKLEGLDEQFGDEFEAAAEEVDQWVSANCAELAEEFDLDSLGGLGG